jgi:hypothetical protein
MIFYKLRNPEEIEDGIEYGKKRYLKRLEIKEYEVQGQKRIFIFIG